MLAEVIDFEAEKRKREALQNLRREKEAQFTHAATVFVTSFNEINGGKSFDGFSWIRLANLYAIASICYYKQDFSPMSDATFDALCLHLLDNLDEALADRAGGLGEEKFLKADMLAAGSGFDTSLFDNFLIDAAHFVESIMVRQND